MKSMFINASSFIVLMTVPTLKKVNQPLQQETITLCLWKTLTVAIVQKWNCHFKSWNVNAYFMTREL